MKKAFRLNSLAKEKIRTALNEILKTRTEIRFAFLHGSFLEMRSFHDVDVAVYLYNEEIPEDLLEYELSLSSILEGSIRMPMDVKILNFAPIAFRYEVTRGEVIFSRDEEARFGFIENTWNEYLDYRPVAEQILQDLAA